MSVLTRVVVDGTSVGGYVDGTWYAGDGFSTRQPKAHLGDDGRVTSNEGAFPAIGSLDAEGVIRLPYDGQVVGRVVEGRLLSTDDRVLAVADGIQGPDSSEAAPALACWLLLDLQQRKRAEENARAAATFAWASEHFATKAPPCAPTPEPSRSSATSSPPPPQWKPGDPYPASHIPDPDGPGPRGLFGRGPKRAGAFRVGDHVHVQIVDRYLGTARVLDVSNTFERGFGTKVYPSFLVQMDQTGERHWLNGIALTKIR